MQDQTALHNMSSTFSTNSLNRFRLGHAQAGDNPVLGKTRGQTFPMHIKHIDDEADGIVYDDEDEEFDEVDIDAIKQRTDAYSLPRNDLGQKHRDLGNAITNVGGYLTMEFAGDHTTPIVKGISPRMTYRANNSKGPSQNGQGAATYIRNAPGRKSGTHFGTSRAPLPKEHEDDENVWSLTDIDPHQNAVERQNRIRRYIQSLE